MARQPTMPGRFVVELQGERRTNLAAHEVVELLDRTPDAVIRILRVHRVQDNGETDLVGVSAESFRIGDGIVFAHGNVAAARRDFDAIVDLAAHDPPPCRVDLMLTHTKNSAASHAVALAFPAAAGEGVGQWLSASGFATTASVDASPRHFKRHEEGVSQVILRATLEPSPAEG